MKFSFVLPAYKGCYLKEAIESILRQDYDNFELIVVDDCSPENLHEIVSDFHDNRLSYHRNEQNVGGTDLVDQWNHSLSFASGDYVILATDDDLYEPYFLSSFIPLISKYPEVALFRARVLQVDSQNRIKYLDSCFKEFLSPIEFRYHLMHGMRGGIPQYIFKRKTLLNMGGFISFPKAWASDDATALMMSYNGVVNSQEHLVRFRWSDINISNDKKCSLEKFRARLLFSQWLRDNQVSLHGSSEWERFYQSSVIDYLPTYNKISLISTMSKMSWSHWMLSMKMLRKCDFLAFRDKCSIVLRSLKQRLGD